jgi:ATP-dependent DNA helicase DinG
MPGGLRRFARRQAEGEPHVVLAEAGTGVGKTLGYLAPDRPQPKEPGHRLARPIRAICSVRPILAQSFVPDPARKAEAVVIRMANYLCLLNYDEAVQRSVLAGRVALGLVAGFWRRDGDIRRRPVGSDRSARRQSTLGLTDRRGECVYAACPHYRTCFIEKTQRRADSEIVIANHASLVQAARRPCCGRAPTDALVFDEAHHVFDAADSAFSRTYRDRRLTSCAVGCSTGRKRDSRPHCAAGLKSRSVT